MQSSNISRAETRKVVECYIVVGLILACSFAPTLAYTPSVAELRGIRDERISSILSNMADYCTALTAVLAIGLCLAIVHIYDLRITYLKDKSTEQEPSTPSQDSAQVSQQIENEIPTIVPPDPEAAAAAMLRRARNQPAT